MSPTGSMLERDGLNTVKPTRCSSPTRCPSWLPTGAGWRRSRPHAYGASRGRQGRRANLSRVPHVHRRHLLRARRQDRESGVCRRQLRDGCAGIRLGASEQLSSRHQVRQAVRGFAADHRQDAKSMCELAQQIATAHHWQVPAGNAVRAVFDQLSADYPKSDGEMIGWYRDAAAFRLVDFARKTNLFDVPASYSLEVVQTPPSLESSIDGASYYPRTTVQGALARAGSSHPPTTNCRQHFRQQPRGARRFCRHGELPGRLGTRCSPVRKGHPPVRLAFTPGAVEDHRPCGGRTRWRLKAGALRRSDGRTAAPGAPNGRHLRRAVLLKRRRASSIATCASALIRDLHTGRIGHDDVDIVFRDRRFPSACVRRTGCARSAARRQSAERHSPHQAADAATTHAARTRSSRCAKTPPRKPGAQFSTKAHLARSSARAMIPSGAFQAG